MEWMSMYASAEFVSSLELESADLARHTTSVLACL